MPRGFWLLKIRLDLQEMRFLRKRGKESLEHICGILNKIFFFEGVRRHLRLIFKQAFKMKFMVKRFGLT